MMLRILVCCSCAAALQLAPGAPHHLMQTTAAAALRASNVVMMGRKGKPQMPSVGGMAMPSSMQQMPQAPPPPKDGIPVFYLYCRSGVGKPWYPVSAMKGDGQSKGLINAWLNSPFGKQVFKDRLDQGMARSIFDSERRLADMACEQYRQLKDFKARLQWGFKILDADVMAKEASGEIEKQKIIPVSKSMLTQGGLLDRAKDALAKVAGGSSSQPPAGEK